MRSPDVVVDARGVLCPVPIIRLARTAGTCPEGTVLALLTDDPAAAHDVPAWCRLRGHELLATDLLSGAVDDPAAAVGSAADDPTARVLPAPVGVEPHAPNADPGQSLRHLIRVRGAATGVVG